MKICQACQTVMIRSTTSGRIMFRCPICAETSEGDEWDSLIVAKNIESGTETEGEKYSRLLVNAAHDPVNQKVKKECPKCGLDYMTQVRVGEQEIIIYTCKCGNEIRP